MQARDVIQQLSLKAHPEGGWYRELYRSATRVAALELFIYDPASQSLTVRILDRLGAGEPVAVVPAGIWQAARSLGDYSLAGCHVAPGFEFQDFHFVSALEDHERHFADRLKGLDGLL